MATLPIASRSFERTLGRPSRKGEPRPDPRAGDARRTFYDRLLQVTIESDYYNESGDRCPDFSVIPTPATAALMASLGLLFKDEGAGFSVLYDRRQKPQLANYLFRQQQNDPQSWTRLTFALATSNPYFVSFTDIPIDTNPARENLYLSNRDVEGSNRDAVFLPTGPLTTEDLRSVIPVQVEVPVSEEVSRVQVLDIAGQMVICKPRCVTRKAWETKTPETFTCKDEAKSRYCTKVIFLEFSSLPEDLYTLQEVDNDGSVRSREVVYTLSNPVPLCLLDLLFSAPPKEPAGIYPVRFAAPGLAEFFPVHYVVRFERRSVKWRYYIVPPPCKTVPLRPSSFRDLRIESDPPVAFRGPREVVLANGQTAYRFASIPALPLMERSPYHFRLWGRHELSAHEQVLVDRLPVASGQRVVPSRRPGAPAHSDVFVYI